MDPMVIGLIGLAVLFLLVFLGLHMGFATALVAFLGYGLIDGFGAAVNVVGMVPYTTVASYVFSVVPLFLLMGDFASTSGLMRDAYRSMYTWLGHLPGGLAMATIGGCAGFAAVTGSSGASAVLFTRVSLPEMDEYKYDPKLATGCIAAGGTLGILIPPSTPFILYGLITDTSVGQLFMAGILPGILLSLLFMATIYILVKRNPLIGPPGPRFGWRQRLASVKGVWGVVALFLLVMGGIWGGIFTPTEGGAVGAFATLLFALGRRQLTWQNLSSALELTVRTTGMVFILIIGAMIFTYFMAVSRLPFELANFVAALPIPTVGILICILLVFFIVGCLMSSLALVVVLTPIFFPIILGLGYDPIWFGVIVILMMEMGQITPPVGGVVFMISGMVKDRGIEMYTIFRGIVPFVVAALVCVAILIAFPQIALLIPKTMVAVK